VSQLSQGQLSQQRQNLSRVRRSVEWAVAVAVAEGGKRCRHSPSIRPRRDLEMSFHEILMLRIQTAQVSMVCQL
jgi:hypothetical protein